MDTRAYLNRQVDHYASEDALQYNLDMEYKRNRERYVFLKWAQYAFDNLRVFPPGATRTRL